MTSLLKVTNLGGIFIFICLLLISTSCIKKNLVYYNGQPKLTRNSQSDTLTTTFIYNNPISQSIRVSNNESKRKVIYPSKRKVSTIGVKSNREVVYEFKPEVKSDEPEPTSESGNAALLVLGIILSVVGIVVMYYSKKQSSNTLDSLANGCLMSLLSITLIAIGLTTTIIGLLSINSPNP